MKAVLCSLFSIVMQLHSVYVLGVVRTDGCLHPIMACGSLWQYNSAVPQSTAASAAELLHACVILNCKAYAVIVAAGEQLTRYQEGNCSLSLQTVPTLHLLSWLRLCGVMDYQTASAIGVWWGVSSMYKLQGSPAPAGVLHTCHGVLSAPVSGLLGSIALLVERFHLCALTSAITHHHPAALCVVHLLPRDSGW